MKRKLIKMAAVLLVAVILMPTFQGFALDGYEVKAYHEEKVQKEQQRLLAGEYNVGVIGEDGKLYAWGTSYYPPDDYAINSNIPMIPLQAEEMEGIVGGSMGDASVGVILKDKSLHTWGLNSFGMCGNGEAAGHDRKRMEVFQNVRSVSMGSETTMIVTYDNELYGCGSMRYGQLTDAIGDAKGNTPVKIMDNIAAACTGGWTVAAITTDGELYTWGRNFRGKLGNGTTEDSSVPEKVEGLEKVVSVSVGTFNMAAITEDGSLYTWGDMLGSGNDTHQSRPVKIMDHVKSVCMGYETGAAITEDGSLYTWGAGDKGQLGNGENNFVHKPQKIMDDVIEVAWGNHMGMALTRDGNVWTWGRNDSGQLGNGTNTDSNVPLNVFNIYSGICDGREYGNMSGKTYEFDYDVNTYNKSLAEQSALYAMLAYDEYRVSGDGQYYVAKDGRRKQPDLLIAQLKKDGFGYIKPSSSYRDGNEHNCSYTFASRQINYNGEKKNQILIDIRGTDGAEWEGNMKLTGKVYVDSVKDTHYSFKMAKNLILLDLELYMTRLQLNGIDTKDSVIWVTGHSRGGAVANLLAADLSDLSSEKYGIGDVFGYTFATANATMLYKDKSYSNIFNHCFQDDFVPSVPLESWGYGNYGQTLVTSADRLYGSDSAFRNSMKKYTSLSDSGRSEADFNEGATSNLIKYVGFVWRSSEEYYEERTNNQFAPYPVSLYMFFNDAIAIIAQEGKSKEEKGKKILLAFAYSFRYNMLQPVYDYFIVGNKFSNSINDTHQSYTYYLATKLGKFQFVNSSYTNIASNASYSKADISNSIGEYSVSANEIVSADIIDGTVSSNSAYDIYAEFYSKAGETSSAVSLTQDEEKQRMIDFINQEENKKNLEWDAAEPDSWRGVTFDEEGFISYLDLSYKNVTGNLDVSGFSHLVALDCSGSQLSSIDMTDCVSLERVECYFTITLQEVSLKACKKLKYVDCSSCQIRELDLADCIEIEELICSNNQLEKLDLSALSKLYKLLCNSNHIKEMLLPESNQLKHVNCQHNYLTNMAE